jgi:hypothetical protein
MESSGNNKSEEQQSVGSPRSVMEELLEDGTNEETRGGMELLNA